MRPRLREHVRFTERADGTYVHAPHGGRLLRGAHLHPWLTRLAPFLTGEHTLAELVAELPRGQRETVEGLVRTLARDGYVRDAVPERPHGLTADERRVHTEHLAHLRYVADSPEHRFQRVREAHVAVCAPTAPPGVDGEGAAAAALAVLGEVVRLGARAGWRTVEAAVPDERAARKVRGIAGAALRDPSQEVRVTVAERADAVTGDLVVRVDTGGGRGEGEPAVHCGVSCAVRVGEREAWVGPVGEGASGVRPDGVPGAEGVPEGVATVIAGHAVLACERYLTGLETRGTAVRIDMSPSGPTTTEHAVAAPDRTPSTSPEAVAAWWRARGDDSADPVEELWERALALVDPHTGPVRELTSGSWRQFPLWTYGAVLRDGRTTGAHGSTREAARRAALLRALAAHEAAALEGPAWGWDLAASRPRPVRRDHPGVAALGAGIDVESAVADGVRAAAEELLAQRLRAWRAPFPEVPAQKWGLLGATGTEVRGFDLARALGGASAYAVTLDGATAALCCGDVERARDMALAGWQAHRDAGNPAPYAPYVAGELPQRLRGTQRTAPEGSGDAEHPRPGPLEALVASGARPVVVPLRGGAPCVVRVVLTGEDA